MKKLYDTPNMLVISLNSEDIMTNSLIITVHENGGNGDLDFFEFPC